MHSLHVQPLHRGLRAAAAGDEVRLLREHLLKVVEMSGLSFLHTLGRPRSLIANRRNKKTKKKRNRGKRVRRRRKSL